MTIILSLGVIQALGIISLRYLNSNAGVFIHGFISGLISSTALTVSLAKKSNTMTDSQKSVESLSFLSASFAMLTQGLFLCIITLSNIDFKSLNLFLFPMVTTIALMIRRAIHTKDISLPKQELHLNWLSILKLSLFVCLILSISIYSKNWIGDMGLQMITFIISLFEAHGSIVASSQLLSTHKIEVSMFHSLIALSILASYVSKLIIVYILATPYLKRKVTLWVVLILISLSLSLFV